MGCSVQFSENQKRTKFHFHTPVLKQLLLLHPRTYLHCFILLFLIFISEANSAQLLQVMTTLPKWAFGNLGAHFLHAKCPFCNRINSIKALKVIYNTSKLKLKAKLTVLLRVMHNSNKMPAFKIHRIMNMMTAAYAHYHQHWWHFVKFTDLITNNIQICTALHEML